MQTNSSTEIATRKAKARIMALVLGLPSRPSRTMDTPANIKAPSTATSANMIKYFMGEDYRAQCQPALIAVELTQESPRV